MTSSLCSLCPEPRVSWAKLGRGNEFSPGNKKTHVSGALYSDAIFLCLQVSECIGIRTFFIFALIFLCSKFNLAFWKYFSAYSSTSIVWHLFLRTLAFCKTLTLNVNTYRKFMKPVHYDWLFLCITHSYFKIIWRVLKALYLYREI